MPSLFPNSKLKMRSIEEEEESSVVTFPLSLSLPLPNSHSQDSSMTTIKTCNRRSNDSSLNYFFAGSMFVISVIVTRQLLSWSMHLYQKKNVFISLWDNITRCFLNRFFRGKVAWGDLPLELLQEIGKRIESRLDILRFRSVCKKFRSCLPCPTRFPLRVPPPPNYDREFLDVPFFVTELTIYRARCGSFERCGLGKGAKRWEPEFYEFEEVGEGGKFLGRYLRGPDKVMFSPDYVIQFPENPLSEMQLFSKAYRLRVALPPYRRRVGGQYWDLLSCYDFARKMVLICANADGVNPSYVRAADISVVVLMSFGTMKGRLALMRLGGTLENREWDTDFCSQVFDEIATYRGRLCALDPSGRVLLMDQDSLQMTQVSPPSPIPCAMRLKYLYEDCGDLYLADYSLMDTGVITGYKLCFQQKKWVWVKGIGHHLRGLTPFLV